MLRVRIEVEDGIEIDVRRGVASLYLEAPAADGQIRGYAKPIFDHLELEPPRVSSTVGKIKAWGAQALAKILKSKTKERIATRLDFEGPLDDPRLVETEVGAAAGHPDFDAARSGCA